jgi:hypothetical protein
MVKSNRQKTLLVLGIGAALGACDGSGSSSTPSTPINMAHGGDTFQFDPGGSGLSYNAGSGTISDPTVDFMLALRTTSLKLRGNMPSLDEQLRMQAAVDSGNPGDAQLLYESIVQGMIFSSPTTFNRQMFHFWRNTLRQGGPSDLTGRFGTTMTTKQVNLDTAPSFATMLIAEDRDMRELFTGQTSTCPKFDQQTGAFAKADCNASTTAAPGNNVPTASQAGVLTNPGFLAQYYSNFGFRRARMIQEMFACTRYPAELSTTPKQIGPYLYSSPWPEGSVSNASPGQAATFNTSVRPRMVRGAAGAVALNPPNTEAVDFKVDCQNCHTSLNHRAPMFAMFDEVGVRDPNNIFMVTSTASGSPFAQIQEYLFQCNPSASDTVANPKCASALAWRFETNRFDTGGTSVPDFAGFGRDMAADPQVARCFMIRAWNYAYSRDDVVNELALVPTNVIQDLTDYFVQNNYNYKKALLKLYTSANYIRF